MDQLQEKGRIETLIRSLAKFSEKALLILSGKSDIKADSLAVGPALIFQRLWERSGIQEVTGICSQAENSNLMWSVQFS